MNELDIHFRQIYDGLLSWRRIGHGLWPLRHWPESVIGHYLLALQEDCRILKSKPPFVFFVQNGRDLIFLIRTTISRFRQIPFLEESLMREDHPAQLLETILSALIGLVYAEEPGELTIEDILKDA